MDGKKHKMSRYLVRINGTGNAWPVPLGSDHPFYSPQDAERLANASFSILKSSSGEPGHPHIEWELLIDAGHGIVQYLIRHGNRLPDALVLTHSHLDHTVSLDWILQSYYRHHRKERKLSLYASRPVWSSVSSAFPQLPPLTDYREIRPGEPCSFEGMPGVSLIPFPVYHGEKAPGPMMMVFELSRSGGEPVKLIFTGDLLCPLLREEDYAYLRNAELAIVDANNRFPYPSTNHWSLSGQGPEAKSESLSDWRRGFSCKELINNHLIDPVDPVTNSYLEAFLSTCDDNMPLCIFDFCRRVTPRKSLLVHYSGMEDRNHYGEAILNPVQLENWAGAEAERRGIGTEFRVPAPGDLLEIPGSLIPF